MDVITSRLKQNHASKRGPRWWIVAATWIDRKAINPLLKNRTPRVCVIQYTWNCMFYPRKLKVPSFAPAWVHWRGNGNSFIQNILITVGHAMKARESAHTRYLQSKHSWGGGYWANFLHSVILLIFFITTKPTATCIISRLCLADGCYGRWAAETSDKYERQWKYLTYLFAESKIPVTEKSTSGALVPPPLALYDGTETLPDLQPVTDGFPAQSSSNVELWCFLCSWPEQAVRKRVKWYRFNTPWLWSHLRG